MSMNAAASPKADGTSQLALPVVEVIGADDGPARATVSFVQLERDHALLVVRGAVCEVFLLTLRQHLANLVAAGVRFVVLDLAEVTACPPEMVGELATACRELYTRQGWLRSITTAPCVADALESAELDDLSPSTGRLELSSAMRPDARRSRGPGRIWRPRCCARATGTGW